MTKSRTVRQGDLHAKYTLRLDVADFYLMGIIPGVNMSETKTISLMKGKEQFCFRYEVGQESVVLDALIKMVNRRDVAFDWFDAAVLSHQLGQHLAKELKAFLPKKAA